jgi:hypothetical protein
MRNLRRDADFAVDLLSGGRIVGNRLRKNFSATVWPNRKSSAR